MSNQNIGLDEQLFHSEQVAPLHGAAVGAQFKDVTLTAKVGEFEVGHKFAFAVLVGDASLLVLIDEDQTEHAFRLNMAVGEPVDIAELRAAAEAEEHEHGPGCNHNH